MKKRLTVRIALWLWLIVEAGILFLVLGDLTQALVIMLFLRLAVIGVLSYYVGRVLNPTVLTFRECLWLWLGEWWAFVFLFMGLQLLPKRWHEVDAPVADKHVILVHGFFCNAGLWSPLARRLERRGYSTSFVEMPALLGSLDDFAEKLHHELRYVALQNPKADVSVVAFSMGGLASRYCLRFLTSKPFRLITVHSPHKGTILAKYSKFFGSENGQQMVPGNPWLADLAKAESEAQLTHITTFWSTNDTIVLPAENGEFGDTIIVERGKGHLYAAIDRSLHLNIIEQLNLAILPS